MLWNYHVNYCTKIIPDTKQPINKPFYVNGVSDVPNIFISTSFLRALVTKKEVPETGVILTKKIVFIKRIFNFLHSCNFKYIWKTCVRSCRKKLTCFFPQMLKDIKRNNYITLGFDLLSVSLKCLKIFLRYTDIKMSLQIINKFQTLMAP